jgi:hypothetical protein
MRRWLAVLIVITGGLMCPARSLAPGGTYTLVQCDPLQRAGNEAVLDPSAAYAVRPLCADAAQDFAIKIASVAGAQPDRKGRVYWEAPTGTSIVAVNADAKLRNDNGSRARIFIADGQGREVRRIANGENSATDWEHVNWRAVDAGHERLTMTLSCETNEVCPQSDLAKAWIRNVRIKVRDEVDPVFGRIDGTLFDGGWLRGDRGLALEVDDAESGASSLSVAINGLGVADGESDCPGELASKGFTRRFHACSPAITDTRKSDTTQPPFSDGLNTVSACGSDFAGNRVCTQRTVKVDNAVPIAAFANDQPANDPELIRVGAADSASGISTGQISFRAIGAVTWIPLPTTYDHEEGILFARVDSSDETPGTYEFQSAVSDLAGNSITTTQRLDGSPMQLAFPLKSGVQIPSQLVPGNARRKVVHYGHASRVAGRLLDSAGHPLSHRPVQVVEHFGAGALLSRRSRHVTTDGQGRWSEVLPPGPSRRISVSYAGDSRYLSKTSPIGELLVNSRAQFRVSRTSVKEGHKVRFSGRVGHLGARVPPGGKLIELQVRERPGRWNTVREAFNTNSSGQYRLSYRFGRFYVKDARFRFRVKVTREQGWPYKTPVQSKQRKVIVRGEHQ